MRYLTLFVFFSISLRLCGQGILVDDIDPFIGTGGHGHTHPSATAPFGMVQLGPDTRKEGWDGCGGYHFSDSSIYGFSHTHLSGTGVSDYADILIRPMINKEDLREKIAFRKESEVSKAGYYSNRTKDDILCEMTASERVGIHRYTFPKVKDKIWFYLDLSYRDKTLFEEVKLNEFDDEITSKGLDIHRISSSWATEQHIYARLQCMDFNWELDKIETLENNKYIIEFKWTDKKVDPASLKNVSIEFAVALSGVDKHGALKNYNIWNEELKNEVNPSAFDNTYEKTRKKWQNELNKAQVYGGNHSQKRIYASALYHAFIVPNLWNDVDGRYRGMDNEIYIDKEHNHYTIFSLWDTYRTAHPLYLLTQPDRAKEFVITMLDHFDQTGRLPVWELAANETDCMIGYHSVSVLADALAKGLPIDSLRALNAMIKTAESKVFGLPEYMKNGYLSIQDESESVSKTLEYSYDDACISWSAERLGMDSIASHFWKRSQGWISLFDNETGLFRPRDNGSFLERFDPREVNNNYTEANAWQYSFSPIHDLHQWNKMLNKNNFDLEGQLDALFSQSSIVVGRHQPDVTGLIGQYAHGNEPSHHIASLYSCTKSPEKGHEKIHEILETMYSDKPYGYEGNEDCGQMSAWYVMNSWGIYPMVPGEAKYTLSAPLWDRIVLTEVETSITKNNISNSAIYLHGYSINSRDEIIQKSYLTHEDLEKSKSIEFITGNHPSSFEIEPYENTGFKVHSDLRINPAPIIKVPRGFVKNAQILIESSNDIEEFKIHKSKTIIRGGESENSHRSVAHSTKKPNSWTSEIIKGDISIQYDPGGNSLVDGIFGSTDYHKGNWLGIQGQNLIIHLKPNKRIKYYYDLDVEFSFLKDIRAWIALPKEIQIWAVSVNGNKWLIQKKTFENILNQEPAYKKSYRTVLTNKGWKEFKMWKSEKVSYFEVHFLNAGKLERWHPGFGGESYIFIDEISISEE